MIGRLSGRVVEEAVDGTVVLDVHGVGYEVVVPIGSLGRLLASADPRPSSGAEVSLFVHTHVREDAISLFGFATKEDLVEEVDEILGAMEFLEMSEGAQMLFI